MKTPIRIYIYEDIHQTIPGLRDLLAKGTLGNHFTEPHFHQTRNPLRADFFLFPFSVDPLFQKLGPEACRTFLAALPYYLGHERQHIFFMYDDQNLPLNLPSVIYRYTHDRHLQDLNSITLPALFNHGNSLFKKPEKLTYHVSFTGALSTHFCRLQMIMPFLKATEQNMLKNILPNINGIQRAHSDPQQYKALVKQLKPEMAKIFPRIVQSKGITYYLDLTINQFNLLPEEDRRHLFTKQIEIMQNSLLVLAPRGHGSYTVRFFEILAAGRIPVLISDNYLPPLHWLIDYDDFIFRIPQYRILETRQIIADVFAKHSLSELTRRCFKARKIWEKHFAPQQFSGFLHFTLNEVVKSNYNLNQIKIKN